MHEFRGFKVREDTLDEYIVKEVKTYECLNLTPEDTVLDIGGCIGSFARYALERGAKVISVEPEPDNYKLLCENAPGATVINAAAIVKPREIILYVNDLKNKGAHSIIPTQGRREIKVETVLFPKLLETRKPTKIKMDCEGAEYELLADLLPEHVKAIVLEFHLQKKGERDNARALHESLKSQFAQVVKEPKITEKNWITIGAYRR